MNIYLFELKAHFKFALTWLIAILGTVFCLTTFYPVFNKDIADFLKIINNLPDAVRAALGMNADTIGSILGYFAFLLTFVYLLGSIEAMILGLSILSKEVRERTADFLLSKPVSRIKIVTSKLMASLTLLIVSNIIYFISFYLILLAFANNHFSFNTYFQLTLTVLFIQFLFFALGFLLSVIIPKLKAILPISLGTVFGFYLLGTFTEEKYRIFIPYKYFDVAQILLKKGYELKYVIIAASIMIVFLGLTYLIYKKKDIHAVI